MRTFIIALEVPDVDGEIFADDIKAAIDADAIISVVISKEVTRKRSISYKAWPLSLGDSDD